MNDLTFIRLTTSILVKTSCTLQSKKLTEKFSSAKITRRGGNSYWSRLPYQAPGSTTLTRGQKRINDVLKTVRDSKGHSDDHDLGCGNRYTRYRFRPSRIGGELVCKKFPKPMRWPLRSDACLRYCCGNFDYVVMQVESSVILPLVFSWWR